jgi:hypothetical protein
VAKIHLRTGKVAMLEPDDAPSPPRPKLPAEIAKTGGPKGKGRGGFGPRGAAARVGTTGKYAVSLNLVRDEEARLAVLKRWELASGKALEPIVLSKGYAVEAYLAADNRSALVHVREREDDDESPTRWHVYSTTTGKELGTFANPEDAGDLTALGERIFITVRRAVDGSTGTDRPRTLRAIELRTGKVLWEHELEPLRPPGRRVPGPPP